MPTPDELLSFIDEFRRDGYNIGAAQYIAAQDVLLALAAQGQWPHHPRRLKTLLAPILCSTPQEQAAFYERFEQWLTQQQPTPARETDEQAPTQENNLATLARRSRPWRWIAFAALLLLAAATVIYLAAPKPPAPLRELRGKVIAQDSTAVADATISFLGKKASTDANGHFAFIHSAKDTTAHVQVNHSDFDSIRYAIKLNRQDTNRVVIRLTPRARVSPFSPPGTIIHEPSKNPYGNEQLRLQELVTRINAFADQVALDEDQKHRGLAGWYRNYFAQIRFGATVLPLLIFGVWWLWQLYRRKLIFEKRRASTTPELQRLVVKGASDRLFRGPAFRRTAQLLRRHREAGSTELHAPATVAATIAQGGWFTPIYQTRQMLPEYLVLIDRAGFHDQQARFVDEALKRLQDDGVFVDRYYFDRDPRVCYRADPQAPHFTLDELASRHPEHRLMIFTDGNGLMHPLTGRPQRWLELFAAWNDRAMLTPEAPNHWGYREMALSGLDFVVLPATQAGLNVLVETLQAETSAPMTTHNGAPKFPERFDERPKLYLERHEPEIAVVDQLCGELKNYLGAGGYFWLGACAIYPVLAWDLTLYLGARLTDINGEKLLTEDRLLKLARLPWLRHGSMPDWLRLRLIASLSREQERAIRAALEDLLKSVLEQPRDGFALDVARPLTILKLRDWRRLLRDFLRTEPDDSSLRDYVFLGFMSGRKPSRLTVNVPNFLRRLFFRRGEALLGLRPATLLIFAAVASLLSWNFLPAPTPTMPLVIPRFYVLEDSSRTLAPPIARSDSAASYYAEAFLKNQTTPIINLLQRYQLVDSLTLADLDSLRGDGLAASRRRSQLYRLWLADTLRGAEQLAAGAFFFRPAAPVARDSSRALSLEPDSIASQRERLYLAVLRSTSRDTLLYEEVGAMLKRYNFAHPYRGLPWSNPQGEGINNYFIVSRDSLTVSDRATGLRWQRSGSDDYFYYTQAQAYIDSLNRKNFGDFRDWRLPTLEEAMSLMEPKEPDGRLYINLIFDRKQRWIWTADQYPAARAAWAVTFDGGYCGHVDVAVGNAHVRALR